MGDLIPGLREFSDAASRLTDSQRLGNVREQLRSVDDLLASPISGANPAGRAALLGERANLMNALSKMTVDPFDTMIREAAMAQIRRKDTSSRQLSFVTGPRGLEGPMSNLIFGGGTSMLGS